MTQAARSIGIAALPVQTKDCAARAFYLAQAELLEFPAGSGALWLMVHEITHHTARYACASTSSTILVGRTRIAWRLISAKEMGELEVRG
jgi:hypothetical protein